MKHETILTGMRLTEAPALAEPTILRFEEPGFVNVFLAELQQPDWQARLAARTLAPGADGTVTVEQPVHRAFHLAVIDARCLSVGMPRLDPDKVASAGLVVRRVTRSGPLGWMRRDAKPVGWKPVPADVTAHASHDPYRAEPGAPGPRPPVYDPDAALRRARLEGRNPVLRRAATLPGEGEAVSEDVVALFPVPPEICKAIGRTLMFGVLPLTSVETEPEVAGPPPFSRADVAARLPALFQDGFGGATLPPVSPGLVTLGSPPSFITRPEMQRPEETANAARGQGLRTLKSALTWLAQETGAFGEGTEAAILRARLAAMPLIPTLGLSYGAWLELAYRSFLLSDGDTPAALTAPEFWPPLTQPFRDVLIDAAHAAMAARWARVSPLTARFPAGRRRYHLRAFLRIDDCPGCPPRIVWSGASGPFRIKPWYASGDAPPLQIEMPSLTDADIRDMKPNIAVKVPPALQQVMDRINGPDLMEGKHTRTNVSLGMICGFSIPIITICAFIILQIFLQLLNIIFFWLPFVRICIPYPIIETEEE